jgi:hypothetical protein
MSTFLKMQTPTAKKLAVSAELEEVSPAVTKAVAAGSAATKRKVETVTGKAPLKAAAKKARVTAKSSPKVTPKKPTKSADELLGAKWITAGAKLPNIGMFGDWQAELRALLTRSAEELETAAENMKDALGSGDAGADEAVAFVISCVTERIALLAKKDEVVEIEDDAEDAAMAETEPEAAAVEEDEVAEEEAAEAAEDAAAMEEEEQQEEEEAAATEEPAAADADVVAKWIETGGDVEGLEAFGDWQSEISQLVEKPAEELTTFTQTLETMKDKDEEMADACAFFIACAEEQLARLAAAAVEAEDDEEEEEAKAEEEDGEQAAEEAEEETEESRALQAEKELQATTLAAATQVPPQREGWLARWSAAGEAVPEVRNACSDTGVSAAFGAIMGYETKEELAAPLESLLETARTAKKADKRAYTFMVKVTRDWQKVLAEEGKAKALLEKAEKKAKVEAEREAKKGEAEKAKVERARIKALKEAEKARQESGKAEKAAASKAAKAAEKARKEEEKAAEKLKKEAEKAEAAVAREAKKEADKAAKEAKALENQFTLPDGWTVDKVSKKDKAGKESTSTVYVSPAGARVASKAAVLKMAESEAKKAKTQKRMGAFMMGFLKGAPSPTAVAKKAAVGLEKDAAARQAAAVAAPEEEAAEQPEEATGPAATEPAVESEGADANMEEKQAPVEETQEAWMTRWVADGVEVCKEVFPDWEAQATAIIAMDDAEVQSGIDGMGEALESAEQAAMHPALEYVVRYSREVLARR